MSTFYQLVKGGEAKMSRVYTNQSDPQRRRIFLLAAEQKADIDDHGVLFEIEIEPHSFVFWSNVSQALGIVSGVISHFERFIAPFPRWPNDYAWCRLYGLLLGEGYPPCPGRYNVANLRAWLEVVDERFGKDERKDCDLMQEARSSINLPDWK